MQLYDTGNHLQRPIGIKENIDSISVWSKITVKVQYSKNILENRFILIGHKMFVNQTYNFDNVVQLKPIYNSE